MTNWSQERGVADEVHIDQFVASMGGERIGARFPNATFPNCDYIFPQQKVLIELKIIETEFGNTHSLRAKDTELIENTARKFGLGAILRGEPGPSQFYTRAKRNHYRAPLARISEKANRQLRQTKAALEDETYRGLLWLVNDNFRQIGTDLALSLVNSTLGHRNSSIDGVIYVTNHYVDVPNDNYARLVWAPAYSDNVDAELIEFVDQLGAAWFQFQETIIGPMDDRKSGPDISLRGARPIL